MDDLFSTGGPTPETAIEIRPLAERMRPGSLELVVGQERLTGPRGPIGRMVASGRPSSMILWGPPGSGKTTIAGMMADLFGMRYVKLSAIHSGVADLKKTFAEAEAALSAGRQTLLFVDEIHRFNKAQQDGFLPHVENGTIVLVGATTENPSFALNGAILSRCQVLVLESLDETALESVLTRAEEAEHPLPLTPQARRMLIAAANGDARYLLNQVETLLAEDRDRVLDVDEVETLLSRRMANHDRAGDGHYNHASALQKSIRGSDPDAAIYYAARMIDAGEDVGFLFRRLHVIASEDVGAADPSAIGVVMAARQTYEVLGMPEGGYAIAQAVLHLAAAPKSNAAYLAWKAALALARDTRNVAPPKHVLNAPTETMRKLGYKDGYEYSHDWPAAYSAQDYWPAEIGPHSLYLPNSRGAEARVAERMEHWGRLRTERRENDPDGRRRKRE